MEKLKVEGHTNLYRDKKSNAILNTDMNQYRTYIEAKKIKEQELSRIDNIENDLSSLKDDISEIKNLLRSLANGPK